ncbi:MAG: ABC transporter substrate-binding protein [Christensenellales bacterium]|jgi:NitT/TauT family transport system substrate-binding protein
MKKIFKAAALILALVLLLGVAACGKSSSKIRLSEVTHSVFYAPMYVAIELGYFDEAGIEIELTNAGGADKAMTAILASEADIGLMGPEAAVYVYNEGRENHAVVFGQLTKRDGSFLMAREPMPDFTWEDVKGKSIIGGRKGGMPLMTLEYTLKKHGVEPGVDTEVFTHIQFNLMGGAFEGGEGDFVTLFEPTASQFEAEGRGYIVASVGESSGEVPFTAFMATKDFLEKNADVAQTFIDTIQRAQTWVAQSDPAEIAKVILPHFPDTSIDTLTAVAARYKEFDAWMTDPIMKRESFELLQDIMMDAGELDKKADYDAVVDNSFAEKAPK